MSRWAVSTSTRVWRAALTLGPRRTRTAAAAHQRLFSSVQRVTVPCASSGSITLSLHNVSEHGPSHPLIIWIPPFPQEPNLHPSDAASSLPSWLQQFPAAVINYRWSGLYPEDPPSQNEISTQAAPPSPLCWPTPLHDVFFGYSWIQENLAPPSPTKRDIYICSSYLGASLAAGLALTESHDRQPTAVRGLINFNGIYNWTTFLPDHPINKARHDLPDLFLSGSLTSDEPPPEESLLPLLKDHAPTLFRTPNNLFDPFASACLFFHSANLLVPPDFHTPLQPSELTQAINALSSLSMNNSLTNSSIDPSSPSSSPSSSPFSSPSSSPSSSPPIPPLIPKPPAGKGNRFLAFPPRQSTLKLPSTLLLHETTPPSLIHRRKGGGKKKPSSSTAFGGRNTGENSFGTQANELASLMRRSINMLELRKRVRWGGRGDNILDDIEDEEVDGEFSDEAERRVQVGDVGRLDLDALDAAFGPAEDDGGGSDFGLTVVGREMVGEWLEERM